jgi:preprotein translocase subunit SecA
LFEQNYTARAAIIRAVLAGETEEAQRVIAKVPGMSADLVDRILNIVRETEAERGEVRRSGGLHVVGSERHESRRIDNQLRGRAARQGDPGSSRFFLSLDDELMLRFGGERLSNFMNRFEMPEDMPIESRTIEKIIENSQTRLEGYNFDTRKNLVEYDDVMTLQREAIYRERREILLSESVNLDARIQQAFDSAIKGLSSDYLDDYTGYVRREVTRAIGDYTSEAGNKVNLRPLILRLRGLVPQLRTLEPDDLDHFTPDQLTNHLMQMAEENLENGTNLYQLFQAMKAFVPLLPAVPDLAAQLATRKGDRQPAREAARREFLTQLEAVYNEFLSAHIPAPDRDPIWQKAQQRINEAFLRFSVEGVSIEVMRGQQDKFRQRVDDALSELMLDSLHHLDAEQLTGALDSYVRQQAEKWRTAIGDEQYRNFQRVMLLQAIDQEWRDYLTAMDDLRREISLESVAQRDPKVMYKKRSFEMYQDMRRSIDGYVGRNFFYTIGQHQAYVRAQQVEMARAAASQQRPTGYQVVKREGGKGTEVRRDAPKLGRNDPCWCGSGKKYKLCHMKSDQRGGK